MSDQPCEYYALWFRLDHQDRYLLWYSGDQDGVWIDGTNNRIRTWPCADNVRSFALGNRLAWIEEDPLRYDLDIVQSFVQGTTSALPANEALDAWNLFSDIARSVRDDGFLKEDDHELSLYNRLFHVSGILPAEDSIVDMKMDMEPELGENEVQSLRSLLQRGLSMMRAHLSER